MSHRRRVTMFPRRGVRARFILEPSWRGTRGVTEFENPRNDQKCFGSARVTRLLSIDVCLREYIA